MRKKGMQRRVVPGFVAGHLVASQTKVGWCSDQKDKVVCSAYFLSDN